MKKGFTLVELLAVIVILAIIALITVPIIMNIVESSKKATSVESANGYVRAVTNYLIMNVVDDGVYSVFDSNIKAEYTGTKVSNGSITIEKGDIKKANLCINDYSIDYINGVSSISNNDYCKDTNNKTLIVKKNNEELKSIYIGESTNTEIEKEDVTNIVCNNGVTLKEENGKIKVENILSNSECNFNSNLEDTINNIDNTTNNILLLNDIELETTLTIPKGKDVVINLNGKSVSSEKDTISSKGYLTIDDTTGGGIINTIGNNTKVISSDGTKSKLVIKNGYIKGTSTCSEWYCTPIYVVNESNLEISPVKETIFEDGEYKDGVYIESTYGITVWVASASNGVINGGTYKAISLDNATAWQNLVCSVCNTLTINDATALGEGSTIRGQKSGHIIVNGGNYESSLRGTIMNDSDFIGLIDINGGVYESNGLPVISCNGASTINIKNAEITVNGESVPAVSNNFDGCVVNICSATIKNADYDLSAVGTINYNPSTITWSNNKLEPTIKSGEEYIKSNNELKCD